MGCGSVLQLLAFFNGRLGFCDRFQNLVQSVGEIVYFGGRIDYNGTGGSGAATPGKADVSRENPRTKNGEALCR
jgi:hypothetical protein